MVFLLLLIFAIILVVSYLAKQYQIYKIIDHIPGPKPLPIIGNALELGTNNEEVLNNLNRLVEKYGNVVRLCIGSKIGVLVADATYVNQVFTVTENYYKGDLYDFLKPLLGDGLLTSSGEIWTRQRRILNSAFSNKQLEKYAKVFDDASNKLVEQLKNQTNVDYVDITDYVYNFTLNCICMTVMKIDITENVDFHDHLKTVLALCVKRYMSPLKRLNFLYRFTDDYTKSTESVRVLRNFVADIIQKHKIEQQSRKSSDSSILDELLQRSEKDRLSDEEIIDQINTFISAGSDTTGSTLSFAIYELGKHPEIQKKILNEVKTFSGTETFYHGLNQLKYTECVLKEVLRKYCPATFVTRVLPKTIYLGDLMVPKNTTVVIYPPGVHMSRDTYPEPEKFDPDRFLPENNSERSPNSFIPFVAGARSCIGQKFAMLEAKVALAKIVKHFEIIAHPEHKVKLISTIVLNSANGFPVKLKLRETSE